MQNVQSVMKTCVEPGVFILHYLTVKKQTGNRAERGVEHATKVTGWNQTADSCGDHVGMLHEL